MLCALRFGHSASTVRCQLKLFGAGPALDAAAAMAVVLAVLGEAVIERAVTGLGVVAPSPGRLCPLPGPAGALILDDSYNANPASMRASIDTALQLARARGGRVLLVLGDMLELGQGSRAEHESIGRQAAQVGVAAFIACGLEMTAAAETAREKARQDALDLSIAHLGDPLAVAEILRPLLREGDVVLVKGSRSMGMERVVERLAPHGGGTP
jgi:UDP-N-acetylmuramoyl-tripeptide--D-alanyl-D-alanine ligase